VPATIGVSLYEQKPSAIVVLNTTRAIAPIAEYMILKMLFILVWIGVSVQEGSAAERGLDERIPVFRPSPP
jgi:hypothetical protein